MRKSKYYYIVFIYILWLSLAVAFLLAIWRLQWSTAFVAFSTYLLTLAPFVARKRWKIHIPNSFLFAIVLFIYASIFLGEVHNFYDRFAWWDAVLHLTSAVGFALVGFIAILLIDENENIQARPLFVSFMAFMLSVAVAGIWEIFEFTSDQLIGSNMQKNGLVDTMWDLIIGTIGAFIATVSGYFYITRKHRGFLNKFIHESIGENRKHFRLTKRSE